MVDKVERVAERDREPGFYWVLPVFDPDTDEEWVNKEQPAHWDGKEWRLLGTEEWAVRWVGDRIAALQPKEPEHGE